MSGDAIDEKLAAVARRLQAEREARGGAPSPLRWRLKCDAAKHPYLASDPPGFTVAMVRVPAGGKPTPMFEAWDARGSPAIRLGGFPQQDQAKVRAQTEYATPSLPTPGDSHAQPPA